MPSGSPYVIISVPPMKTLKLVAMRERSWASKPVFSAQTPWSFPSSPEAPGAPPRAWPQGLITPVSPRCCPLQRGPGAPVFRERVTHRSPPADGGGAPRHKRRLPASSLPITPRRLLTAPKRDASRFLASLFPRVAVHCSPSIFRPPASLRSPGPKVGVSCLTSLSFCEMIGLSEASRS